LAKKVHFDLVVSGINKGNNAGLNVMYSGTVGAAIRARCSGVNSIALSLDHPSSYLSGQAYDSSLWNFDLAAIESIPIIKEVLNHDPLHRVLLNVNFPNVHDKSIIKGLKQTRQGWSGWNNSFQVVGDCSSEARKYRNIGIPNLIDEEEDIDTRAMREGWISITPLGVHLDPLCFDEYQHSLKQLSGWTIFSQ